MPGEKSVMSKKARPLASGLPRSAGTAELQELGQAVHQDSETVHAGGQSHLVLRDALGRDSPGPLSSRDRGLMGVLIAEVEVVGVADFDFGQFEDGAAQSR